MSDAFDMKQIFINADDFGLCPEVNEAVIRAHREGILTSASLMISAPAVEEAVALAKKNSTLKVGLHLVLVEGQSILPQKEIPNLVDAAQNFSSHVVRSGLRYFFSRRARVQIAKECKAQIEKFLATGLKLNHLDSHNHLHIHPVVADIVVELAQRYQIPRVRVPWQPSLQTAMLLPWAFFLRRQLARSGIATNDAIFGLRETGQMTVSAWLQLVPKICDGITEIYCHPAVASAPILEKTMPGYRHVEEFEALLNPVVRRELEKKCPSPF